MRRIVREPLFHFAVAAALLFGAHGWQISPEVPSRDELRVGMGDVQWLEATWTRQWQRPPSARELRGLVADLVREELLAREARELGLDENDTLIRRRLAQKLEFLVTDTTRLVEPSEEALHLYYEGHRERFTEPARISFTQVLFRSGSPDAARVDAATALERVDGLSAEQVAAFGHGSLVESEIEDADRRAVESRFGPAFADHVLRLPAGSWQGPIESSYGFHLVRVETVSQSRSRSYEEARGEVLAELRGELERVASAKYFAELLRRYPVASDEGVRMILGEIDGALLGSATRNEGEAS